MMLPLSLLSLYIFTKLHIVLHGASQASLSGLRMWAFPLLWFFQFLFYNEVPSTLFVLWMHLEALRQRYILSAMVNRQSEL